MVTTNVIRKQILAVAIQGQLGRALAPVKPTSAPGPQVFMKMMTSVLGRAQRKHSCVPAFKPETLSRQMLGSPQIPGQSDEQSPQAQRESENHSRKWHMLPTPEPQQPWTLHHLGLVLTTCLLVSPEELLGPGGQWTRPPVQSQYDFPFHTAVPSALTAVPHPQPPVQGSS